MREQMGETYRTLLGHFRHEIGHYYWDRLIKDSPRLDQFRALFGDETSDYAEAQTAPLRRAARRRTGSGSFVSAYASMHPWEDWAETFAHYLHMVDTLETARSLRPGAHAQGGGGRPAARTSRRGGSHFDDFDELIAAGFR